MGKEIMGGTPVLADTAQTLTNKTINFNDNTLTGVVSTDTIQTLTNKTINYSQNTLTGVQPTITAGAYIVKDANNIIKVQKYLGGGLAHLNPADFDLYAGQVGTWVIPYDGFLTGSLYKNDGSAGNTVNFWIRRQGSPSDGSQDVRAVSYAFFSVCSFTIAISEVKQNDLLVVNSDLTSGSAQYMCIRDLRIIGYQ